VRARQDENGWRVWSRKFASLAAGGQKNCGELNLQVAGIEGLFNLDYSDGKILLDNVIGVCY
jgi:hypothetical protein